MTTPGNGQREEVQAVSYRVVFRARAVKDGGREKGLHIWHRRGDWAVGDAKESWFLRGRCFVYSRRVLLLKVIIEGT